MIHQFYREQYINSNIEEVWNFFSNPQNLSKITPPDLDFRIINSLDSNKIYSDMRIEYAVKPLLNIPVKWVTRIQEVKEYNCFTDVQEKGPYSLWEHTHTFEECGDSVLMKDHIRYKLPLGILGNVFHFVVLKKLKNIFKFRKEFIENKFNNYGKLVA